jgi:formate-dependent nitrite reductase membrane component NrfD
MRTQWRALALRLTVLTLPAQLVGALVGFLPTLLLGRRLVGVPWLPGLVLVGIGVVAGLAIGKLAHPPRDQLRAAVALAAGFALVGVLILRLLVQVRLPAGTPSSVLPWLIGALVVVALQSLVVYVAWRRRSLRGTDGS